VTLPIQIDARSPMPIYEQVAAQVRHAVASGVLRKGDALPSVRQLAVSLRVNPNTVARAYRDLEAEGVVETQQGRGTFVAQAERRLSPGARRRALVPAAERLAAEANALGLSPKETADIVLEAARRMASDRERQGDET